MLEKEVTAMNEIMYQHWFSSDRWLSEHLCNQIRKNTETIGDLELFLN